MVDDSNTIQPLVSQTDDQQIGQLADHQAQQQQVLGADSVSSAPLGGSDDPGSIQPPVQELQEPEAISAATQNPSAKQTSSDPQKNPLDVLEQLLSEIDGGKPGRTPVPEKTGPTPEELAAIELEKRRIEFEEKQAAQKIIDQQKIEEQRQILYQEMSTGVANVARAQQDEEKKAQEEDKKLAEEGFEIIQINHTKI